MDFTSFVDIQELQFDPTNRLTPGTVIEFGDHGRELEWAIVNTDEIICWRDGRVMSVRVMAVHPKCRLVLIAYLSISSFINQDYTKYIRYFNQTRIFTYRGNCARNISNGIFNSIFKQVCV